MKEIVENAVRRVLNNLDCIKVNAVPMGKAERMNTMEAAITAVKLMREIYKISLYDLHGEDLKQAVGEMAEEFQEACCEFPIVPGNRNGAFDIGYADGMHDNYACMKQERDAERERVMAWLGKFCRHIDLPEWSVSDEENTEFFRKKMCEQFGWGKEGDAE